MPEPIWEIVAGVSGILAAALAGPPAYATIRDALSKNEQVQEDLLRALPSREGTGSDVDANGTSFSKMTEDIAKPPSQIRTAIATLINEGKITAGARYESVLEDAFVMPISVGQTKIIVPVFYKGRQNPPLRVIDRDEAKQVFAHKRLWDHLIPRIAAGSLLSLAFVALFTITLSGTPASPPVVGSLDDLVGTWCAGGSRSLRFEWTKHDGKWLWRTSAEYPIPRTWDPANVDVRWVGEAHAAFAATWPYGPDGDGDAGTIMLWYSVAKSNNAIVFDLIGLPILKKPDGSMIVFTLDKNKGFVKNWSQCPPIRRD